jgi:hypothetical protein
MAHGVTKMRLSIRICGCDEDKGSRAEPRASLGVNVRTEITNGISNRKAKRIHCNRDGGPRDTAVALLVGSKHT